MLLRFVKDLDKLVKVRRKGIIGLVVLVLIQFIRPTKNDSNASDNHISKEFNVPESVEIILKTSCYDCHSNYTEKVWYADVSPVSWMLSKHVKSGKEHVNFSEWMGYNKHQKEFIKSKLLQCMEQQTMPTKGYVMLHKEAALSKKQQQVLVKWFQTLKK